MHIADQVRRALFAKGWIQKTPHRFERVLENRVEAGCFVPDGRRNVILTICERDRYLAIVDGWGKVEKDVDLRDFPDAPADAIEAVLAL